MAEEFVGISWKSFDIWADEHGWLLALFNKSEKENHYVYVTPNAVVTSVHTHRVDDVECVSNIY